MMLLRGPKSSSLGEFPAYERCFVYVTAALETGISAFLERSTSKYTKPQTLFWPRSGPNNDSPSGLLPQESIQNRASKGLLKQLKTCEQLLYPP